MARRRPPDWTRERRAVRRFAWAGAALGVVAAAVAFAPAAWLAAGVAHATGGRLLLADARGSVWAGSAVAVLTGGEGSRDASALPGRLRWQLGLDGLALGVKARHDCCINGELKLRIQPGLAGTTITLPPSTGALGQWPASWLAGLGTPFNTLQLGGTLSLSSGGVVAQVAQGRWQLAGSAQLAIDGLGSRLATIDPLGSYQVALAGGEVTRLTLGTRQGPLQLSGNGEFTAQGLRFRGEARAEPGTEAGLDNLLNLIGRRKGAVAVLSIG